MAHVPLAYAINCKRNKEAGHPFLVDNLGDDLLIVLVAFALVFQAPVLGVCGIVLLHLSLWAIYEVGYYENDLISATLEPESKTPPKFEEFRGKFSEVAAWIYAAALGAAGILLISLGPDWYFAESGPSGIWTALAIWVLVLAVLRVTYYFYNRVDKLTRVYLYVALQIPKYGFPAAFFGLAPAGAALVFSQILRRWIPYVVYRYSGSLHSGVPIRGLRLFLFLTGWLLLLPSNWEHTEHYLIGGVAFLVLFARGRSQLWSAIVNASSAKHDQWQSRRS